MDHSKSLFLFSQSRRIRKFACCLVDHKWFEIAIFALIVINCIILATNRPDITPESQQRLFLSVANNVFAIIFAVEMLLKIIATGMFCGRDAYLKSGWNIMDGSLVVISIIDYSLKILSGASPPILGILRVFRLLRLLVIVNRVPKYKPIVQTLFLSLRPVFHTFLICYAFLIIFGVFGVKLFKGTFYFCAGENLSDYRNVRNRTDCLAKMGNYWMNENFNFNDFGVAKLSLFVLLSRDGWIKIMYNGMNAVGVDQQVKSLKTF